MVEVEISKDQFIKDRESMTVEEVKEKYDLNNAQYYRLLKDMGIKKRPSTGRKVFKVVD